MGPKTVDVIAAPGVREASADTMSDVAERLGDLPRSSSTQMATPRLPATAPRRRCATVVVVAPVATSEMLTMTKLALGAPSSDENEALMLVEI